MYIGLQIIRKRDGISEKVYTKRGEYQIHARAVPRSRWLEQCAASHFRKNFALAFLCLANTMDLFNREEIHLRKNHAYPAGFAIGSPGTSHHASASDQIKVSQVIAAVISLYNPARKSQVLIFRRVWSKVSEDCVGRGFSHERNHARDFSLAMR